MILPEDPYIEGFPLLQLEVIDTRSKLERFFHNHQKRVQDEQVSEMAGLELSFTLLRQIHI